jgi:hypothetical protein
MSTPELPFYTEAENAAYLASLPVGPVEGPDADAEAEAG